MKEKREIIVVLFKKADTARDRVCWNNWVYFLVFSWEELAAHLGWCHLPHIFLFKGVMPD